MSLNGVIRSSEEFKIKRIIQRIKDRQNYHHKVWIKYDIKLNAMKHKLNDIRSASI